MKDEMKKTHSSGTSLTEVDAVSVSVPTSTASHAEPCYYCDGTDICPECKGEGDMTCECSCGDSHWAVCCECEGSGKCPECEAWRKIEAKKRATEDAVSNGTIGSVPSEAK